jgi:4-hydroxymandelate oxidase
MNVHVNLAAIEAVAASLLPKPTFDYFAGGAADELSLRDGSHSYDRINLRPHVLRDVCDRNLGTSVIGHQIAMPLMVAPMAFQRLAHPEGELATVRASGHAGIPMVLSSLSTQSMETVVAAASSPVWFQLYVYRDRSITRDLIARAEAAGCSALVVTVDAPVQGKRERDITNGFTLPPDIRMENLLPAGLEKFPVITTGSGLGAYINAQFDPSVTWADIEWFRSQTRLPVIVKGVLRGDDAAEALMCGAHAVVVSNHGGRQLDTAIAPIDALPEIVDAVAGRAEVYVDGGVRRGTDVVKALARGARAVLIGRPVLWGLAAGGEAGALQVLDIMRDEFDIAMALCGARTVSEIDKSLLA